ncbi:MAG: double zinc ribbon domain-containing protein [Paracoccaceae bacterium]
MGLQSVLHLIYPPQCLACGDAVDSDHALCGPCRRDAAFIDGLVCDSCGLPLPGEAGDETLRCDDCLTIARPWQRGRAALLYRGTGRRLVLALKHGDRHDLVAPAAGWMARRGAALIGPDTLIAPVPLHRWRLLKRRYNQSALLGRQIARLTGADFCPDLLIRAKATQSQDGKGRDERFANLEGAIVPHPRMGRRARGRPVLLIDDVMTSGATLAAAAEAALAAGANGVCTLVLARVAKDA